MHRLVLYEVPAGPNLLSNALDGQGRTCDVNKDQVDLVSGLRQSFEPQGETSRGKRRLEREIGALGGSFRRVSMIRPA